ADESDYESCLTDIGKNKINKLIPVELAILAARIVRAPNGESLRQDADCRGLNIAGAASCGAHTWEEAFLNPPEIYLDEVGSEPDATKI
ncbi:MAG: hypothetical protein ACREGF_07635, partial [Candidatus Saccharimonadales bacterium]